MAVTSPLTFSALINVDLPSMENNWQFPIRSHSPFSNAHFLQMIPLIHLVIQLYMQSFLKKMPAR